MLQGKSKKIFIYFLLLILVGSINNISLNKIKLSNITDIKILGLGNENNNFLIKNLTNLELGNIFFIDKKVIIDLIENNNLVENYDVFKIYPSTLYINIQKTKFLARTNYDGENFIIGSNGKLIKNSLYKQYMPFIFGNPKIKDFLNFKKIIDDSKFNYNDISNIFYFASGRWDLELTNGLIIKLPEKNIKKSLELLFEFLKNEELKNVKLVDLRVNNQIVLDD